MKKLLMVMVAALLLIPMSVHATSSEDPWIEKILPLYPEVSKAELLEEISQAAKILNQSEKEVAEQIYHELKEHEQAQNIGILSKGGGTTCFLQVENTQFCSEKCQGILPAKFSLQRNTFHRLLEAETLASE